jgi:hypothetical protein
MVRCFSFLLVSLGTLCFRCFCHFFFFFLFFMQRRLSFAAFPWPPSALRDSLELQTQAIGPFFRSPFHLDFFSNLFSIRFDHLCPLWKLANEKSQKSVTKIGSKKKESSEAEHKIQTVRPVARFFFFDDALPALVAPVLLLRARGDCARLLLPAGEAGRTRDDDLARRLRAVSDEREAPAVAVAEEESGDEGRSRVS